MGNFSRSTSEMISLLRYKVLDPRLHKVLFVAENITDDKGRKFLIQALKDKIKNKSNCSFFSPYHISGVIPNVEEWISKGLPTEMAGSWSKNIAPEEVSIFEKPCSINEEISKIPTEFIEMYKHPKIYLCLLKNARILAEDGVIASSDGKVFKNFTFEFGKPITEHRIFRTYLKKSQYKNGKFASIVSPGSSNYFHWIFESLPRLKLLSDVIEEIDYLFVPANLKKFQIESLNHLGISEEKLIEVNNNTHIICENLFVSSIGNSGKMPKWACTFLRDAFLPKIKSKPFRLIYISRKDARYRRVINEEEVETFLQRAGFEIIEMSKLSFFEQIKVCSEAKIVVGPHGAGFSNIVFCQKAKVLEIFAPSYINACYWMLSNQVGNQYFYMLGEEHPGHSSPVWRDFLIDIPKLKKVLEHIIDLPNFSENQ